MTFKDLNITSTCLFKPLFEESFGGADDQINGNLLPFQVNDDVYLIDTYHIDEYSHENYENYVEKLIKNGNNIYKIIPFVNDFYYRHAYKINSIEDLNNRFELICDLKDYISCNESYFYTYGIEDRIKFSALKYDGETTWLIKKGAIKNITLQINNLIMRINKHISYTTPEVYCAIDDIKALKELIKENPDCEYNKDMYDKTLEWYDYMRKIIDEIDKKYEEIFFERGK